MLIATLETSPFKWTLRVMFVLMFSIALWTYDNSVAYWNILDAVILSTILNIFLAFPGFVCCL